MVADCAEQTKAFAEIVFIDSRYPDFTRHAHWEIVGRPEDYLSFANENTQFFVAIGDNQVRQALTRQLLDDSLSLACLIHPSAVVSQYAELGAGTLVCANATINAATQIGTGCIVNTAASVDHDCQIQSFVHIAPGVNMAGTVKVGEGTFIGIGSAVAPNLSIGDNTVVGAGTTVVSPLPSDVVVVGTPARVIKRRPSKIEVK